MKRLIVLLLLLSAAIPAFAADEQRYSVPLNDSPMIGPADAPVTIVEFIDFQ